MLHICLQCVQHIKARMDKPGGVLLVAVSIWLSPSGCLVMWRSSRERGTGHTTGTTINGGSHCQLPRIG